MSRSRSRRETTEAAVSANGAGPDAGAGRPDPKGAGVTDTPAGAPDPTGMACPLPLDRYPTVVLAHGGGGKFSRMLTEEVFVPAFGSDALGQLHDGAILDVGPERLALSTDTFVIDPPFFPGGNIGSLAVHGTVNDLAMCGARPVALSTGFILEEGFPMADVWAIATAMQAAAAESGVRIVTGDTKVVDRGKGDGV
ncbi:MAG: AIR synthase related protein, partial [Longimicrobiales bacterium]|nr:AIR synthase related protein [Longimicrobiales bacterium]